MQRKKYLCLTTRGLFDRQQEESRTTVEYFDFLLNQGPETRAYESVVFHFFDRRLLLRINIMGWGIKMLIAGGKGGNPYWIAYEWHDILDCKFVSSHKREKLIRQRVRLAQTGTYPVKKFLENEIPNYIEKELAYLVKAEEWGQKKNRGARDAHYG